MRRMALEHRRRCRGRPARRPRRAGPPRLSAVNTGEASSTSPWCRSLVTSTRATSASGTGSGERDHGCNDSKIRVGRRAAPVSAHSCRNRRASARLAASGRIRRSPPSAPFRRLPARDGRRRRVRCAEGADPRRGAALHPALPRQDDRREVRRQRDDRAAAEGRVRARRRHAEAGRHEPGDRPRRRAADRRPAEEDGHRERVPAGHARHRRARDERRRDGAGRAQPGDRRPHQPARRQGGRPDRAGRRVHPARAR